MPTQQEIDLILNIWFTCIKLSLSYTIHPRTPIKSKSGGKKLSYKTDVSCDIGHTCQGIIQTKMEVGIQFWAPNLGLSPNMTMLLFRKEELLLASNQLAG